MPIEKKILKAVVLVLFFLPCLALAQSDYVIRPNGDTIKGNLQILDYEQIDRVQIKTNKEKIILTALQVRSINKNKELYRPVRYDNTARFMKVLIDGYLTLNAFHPPNQNSWDGRYLTKLDGTGLEVPNLSFKKLLGNYLSDCGNIKEQIDKGELGKRDLEKIVELYNTCMRNKTVAPNPKTTVTQSINTENEKVLAVKNLIAKVEAENFSGKNDALDILKDIQSKASKNEPIPNYLIDGLKSSLANTPSLTKDLDTAITLLKK